MRKQKYRYGLRVRIKSLDKTGFVEGCIFDNASNLYLYKIKLESDNSIVESIKENDLIHSDPNDPVRNKRTCIIATIIFNIIMFGGIALMVTVGGKSVKQYWNIVIFAFIIFGNWLIWKA